MFVAKAKAQEVAGYAHEMEELKKCGVEPSLTPQLFVASLMPLPFYCSPHQKRHTMEDARKAKTKTLADLRRLETELSKAKASVDYSFEIVDYHRIRQYSSNHPRFYSLRRLSATRSTRYRRITVGLSRKSSPSA